MKHEGWRPVPESYDDGGFSGGNMDRPGLRDLLRDIADRKIDVVVIYKIDRLTRSLTDFGKIVEIFDRAAVTFVSITQSFNTQTSMGRLTLNMLLSFAQFERELGSERVRDKIAASRAKGLWTGGSVPFGYDVRDRRLVVNPQEAEHVRFIMKTYVEVGSVRELIGVLGANGLITKRTVQSNGKVRGGIPFRQGILYHLLRNETYIGLTRYKGQTFPGQHDAIIDASLWDRVQGMLQKNSVDRRCAVNARSPSIFAGLIWDAAGRRMTPSHTQKGSKRYRYYASVDNRADGEQGSDAPCLRIPAELLEALIRRKLVLMLSDCSERIDGWQDEGISAHDIADRLARFQQLARELNKNTRSPLRRMMLEICRSLVVHENYVELRLNGAGIDALAGISNAGLSSSCAEMITIPCKLRQHVPGSCLVLLPDSKDGQSILDRPLVDLLGRAHAARRFLEEEAKWPSVSLHRRRYLTRLARLTFLAPGIVTAILEGKQPAQLTASRLRTFRRLPADWDEQRLLLGFPSHEPAAAAANLPGVSTV